MSDAIEQLNKQLEKSWLDANRLTRIYDKRPENPLIEILDKRAKERVASANRVHVPALFDHVKILHKMGTQNSPSVVHTSPYRGDVLPEFRGSPRELESSIQLIAYELMLNVRIGAMSDVLHLSSSRHDQTIPFVWWNRDRIELSPGPVAQLPRNVDGLENQFEFFSTRIDMIAERLERDAVNLAITKAEGRF